MPLYPQGGGLYPNSIDNVLLADMAEATVKGRAVGAGAGDPQDLTMAQLHAVLGTSFAQCRFVYANSSTMRLQRFGGKLLMINDRPEVIPAAGVDLTVVAGHGLVNPLYIYAYMNAGVMTLLGQVTGPIADPRNGMPVLNSGGGEILTLVGMAYVSSGPTMIENAANQACSSYWNRLPRSYYGSVSNVSTSSTTLVGLGGAIKMITWGDSAYQIHATGYGQLNAPGVTVNQLLADGSAASAIAVAYYPVGNAQYPTPLSFISASADGLHSFQFGGNVSAGSATFNAALHATVMG